MPYCKNLQELITRKLLPDVTDAIDELFEVVAKDKNADARTKETFGELQDFKTALQELLNDLNEGELDADECRQIYEELTESMREDEDV